MSASRRARLRQVRRPAEIILFARIACFAALVPVLHRLELPTVARVLRPTRIGPPGDPNRVQRIVDLTDLAIDTCRPLVRRSCLVRATTLYFFLTRAGVDLSLCFGIGQVDGAFAGHCWLVRDGQPYLEKQHPGQAFTTIYEITSVRSLPFDNETPARPLRWQE